VEHDLSNCILHSVGRIGVKPLHSFDGMGVKTGFIGLALSLESEYVCTVTSSLKLTPNA
jgi:hypothetical protein